MSVNILRQKEKGEKLIYVLFVVKDVTKIYTYRHTCS